MKFIALSLLLPLLLVSTETWSQTDQSKVKFGIKAGINLSAFTNDVGPFDKSVPINQGGTYGSYSGYVKISGWGGITVTQKIKDRFSMGYELLLVGRGASYRTKNSSVVIIGNNGGETAYDYYKYVINYFDLPVTAQYHLGNLDSWHITVYGGLAPSIAVGSKTKAIFYDPNSTSVSPSQTTKEGTLDNVSPFILNALSGFQLESKKFILDFRFEYCLSPVFNKSKDPSGNNLNTRMWTAGFGFGIKL